ncbi:hypothetical protein EGM51_05130 [Verrucomicrobia bacterium S94]|nr:hypothetical protein EGM51_05130 [Verrucomicrobia bacterium S94]
MGEKPDMPTEADTRAIPMTSLKAFEIPLPPLDKQQRIVDLLDALSARIQRLEKRRALASLTSTPPSGESSDVPGVGGAHFVPQASRLPRRTAGILPVAG